jgi:hypothetical protein
MKPVITSVLAAAGLLAWVALAQAQSGQPNTAGQPTGASSRPTAPSPPTPAVGDTFTYESGLVRPPYVLTYLGRNGESVCFSKTQPGQQTTAMCGAPTDAIPGDIIQASAAAGTVRNDFGPAGTAVGSTTQIRLSFPLSVGKTWEYSWQSKDQTGYAGQNPHDLFHLWTTKVQVTGYESVNVSAGTFAAFKIEAISTQWGEMGHAFVSILYYSPMLGVVIKRHSFAEAEQHNPYDYTVELVSYTRAHAGAAR